MTAPQIDPWPPAPGPSDPGEVFDEKAFDFTQSMEPRRQQMNAVAEFINDTAEQFEQTVGQAVQDATDAAESARDTAVASANSAEINRDGAEAARDAALALVGFAGKWPDLTGALNTPATVFHSGAYWRLLNDLVDVTASEPGVNNADWLFVYSNAELRRKLLDEATLYADFVNGDYRLYEGVGAGVVRNKAFGDLFSFTRASDATGQGVSTLETVATDVARFIYSPEINKRQGVLLEGPRTNLITSSEDFVNQWGTVGPVSRTANAATAPDGSMTADRVQWGSAEFNAVTFSLSSTAGRDLVFSVWLKSASESNYSVRLWADGTGGAGKQVTVTPEWQRFEIPQLNNDGSIRAQIGISSPTSAADFYVWGAQLEEGLFPSAYIKTDGLQVTRAADNCSRVLGAEFNVNGFTLIASLLVETPNTTATIAKFGDSLATVQRGLGLAISASRALSLVARTPVGLVSSGSIVIEEGVSEIGISVDLVGKVMQLSANGRVSTLTDISAQVDDGLTDFLTHLYIGGSIPILLGTLDGQNTTKVIGEVRIVPRSSSAAELITITQGEAEQ